MREIFFKVETLICGNESEKSKYDKVIASRVTEVMGAQSRRESTYLVVSKQNTLAGQRVKKKNSQYGISKNILQNKAGRCSLS